MPGFNGPPPGSGWAWSLLSPPETQPKRRTRRRVPQERDVCVGCRLVAGAGLFDIVQFEFDIILPLGESQSYLVIEG